MFLRALNIAGSGLTTQQYRLNIVAENITNIETTRTESGGPYKRKGVQVEAISDKSGFASKLDEAMSKNLYKKPDLVNSYAINNTVYQGSGKFLRNVYRGEEMGSVSQNAGVRVTKVTEDSTPGKMIYDPEHPDADEQGYVQLPNVEMVQEMVDMMGASRSYEANVQVINAIKAMATKALEIGR